MELVCVFVVFLKGEVLGEKDILEKKLLMFNDVFADFVNGIMFDGKDIVKEDELVDLSGWSHYKGDDSKHRFQDRDVVKLWKKENVVISLIGIENQDVPDKNMVFRVCTLLEYLSQSRFKMRLQRRERDRTGKAEITRDRANLTETILRVCDSNNEKNGQNFISVFEVMKNKRIIG